MTQEDIIKYSEIYKRHQKKLSFVLMIIIIAMGVILIGLGLFIAILFKELPMVVAGIIMATLGAFDIPLIIGFNKKTQIRIEVMTEEEAAKRYCKIYGLNK